MLNINYESLLSLFTLQDILNIIIFLILCFLGVAGRIMIEVERFHKKFKDIKFFNRYVIATILAYILELYMNQNNFLRKYYSEIIILFCIFVNDIVDFVFNNKAKIFLYILTAVTRGISDLRKFLLSAEKKEEENNDSE